MKFEIVIPLDFDLATGASLERLSFPARIACGPMRFGTLGCGLLAVGGLCLVVFRAAPRTLRDARTMPEGRVIVGLAVLWMFWQIYHRWAPARLRDRRAGAGRAVERVAYRIDDEGVSVQGLGGAVAIRWAAGPRASVFEGRLVLSTPGASLAIPLAALEKDARALIARELGEECWRELA